MGTSVLVGKGQLECRILLRMANRHGLIAGATGTGKTVTLQSLAEQFSREGIAVFLADVKGDLAGVSQSGTSTPRISERLKLLGISDFSFQSSPVAFWDVFGRQGHPVRTTICEMGPLLLSRLLNLNDVQTGVLTVLFKIADDNGLLLLDLKDLKVMLQYVGDNAAQFTTQYGNVSKATIGSIQRNLLELETQNAAQFFGEPAIEIFDFLRTDSSGRGIINILAASELFLLPRTYATFLLWLLSELFEQLPEVGDLEKPKMVFFFDEAHLLFKDTPPALMEKIEQVIRLIRSKGVGIFFVTQNPRDIPDAVLGQLGNRVQHALRAFTPQEQKAVKAMAQTFRPNPLFNLEEAVTTLGVGEALVSLLEENGAPAITQRALIVPPQGRIGALEAAERQKIIKQSMFYGRYEKNVDRESAFEVLKKRAEAKAVAPEQESPAVAKGSRLQSAPVQPARRGRPADSLLTAVFKSTARSVGSQLGRRIGRGILGSIFGGGR